jgi:hypothetical protein
MYVLLDADATSLAEMKMSLSTRLPEIEKRKKEKEKKRGVEEGSCEMGAPSCTPRAARCLALTHNLIDVSFRARGYASCHYSGLLDLRSCPRKELPKEKGIPHLMMKLIASFGHEWAAI